MEFEPSQVDLANPFDLARRATQAVADNTGSLAYPGRYVRATLELSWAVIPVLMGWERAQKVPVACFFADTQVADVGGTFVGLFGSATNFLGWKPGAEDESVDRWFPSDANGMYQILADTAEPHDPKVSDTYVRGDRKLSSEARIDEAVTIYRNYRPLHQEQMDVLIKPYLVEHNVDMSWSGLKCSADGKRARVIFGAPIWVATPLPEPQPM